MLYGLFTEVIFGHLMVSSEMGWNKMEFKLPFHCLDIFMIDFK